MGTSYYVAIHQADWPSVAAVNECLAGLGYPVRLPAPNTANTPLREMDGSLTVEFEEKAVQLEASITRWSATESFAYGLKVKDGQTVNPLGIGDFVPLDLNTELRRLGADTPNFEYGDYVLTLTFRTSVDEWKAGFLLLSGLIRCSNGLGFDDASYGGVSFADKLAHEVSEME
ncbi:hypothetical protein [Rhizobium sullae]|uniref:Uncharacterized protein n=1 Tax=Rhizobium sullae TaxID=50338 RepID=A0A4V2V8J0_RHISU|nr:hypothetical protein [Rhizobium sullae]TCU13485.1 hypothetical protein EV132_112184 [Rhizobium sullae]